MAASARFDRPAVSRVHVVAVAGFGVAVERMKDAHGSSSTSDSDDGAALRDIAERARARFADRLIAELGVVVVPHERVISSAAFRSAVASRSAMSVATSVTICRGTNT